MFNEKYFKMVKMVFNTFEFSVEELTDTVHGDVVSETSSQVDRAIVHHFFN